MKRLALLVLLLFATPAHATVNEVFARNEYVVAGSGTVFPYTFKILDKVQLTVMVNGVIKNLDTDYSVSGVGDSGGGAVTFVTTPGNGASVVLIRDQPVQQLSTYTANEAFPATRLMNDLDKNIMVDQMQQEEIGRALKFDPQSLFKNVFVDDPIAGQCLAWNASQTRVVSAPCVAGEAVVGPVSGSGVAGQVTFWTAPTVVAGDGKLLWDNVNKSLTVGTLPVGPLKPGNIFSGLVGPMNATGMQNLMLQTVQGDPSLIGLVTLGDDRVGISSWNFRGTGATNPIYGANFGVVFNTPGVANGLEIDVQNDSTTNYIGQALWLNGSTRATGTPGTVGHRANAILIDTQDGSKWERGILFKEGFVGNGATGSIEKMGIHFEHSQDADFIVIQPRVGASANIAFKLTNPEFTVNRFELLNSGAIRVGTTMTGPAFPSYAFVEEQTTGMYLESPSVLGFAISGPLVPGPGVGGFRRMTLGTALNIYPSAATPNNTGTINLWDQFSAHSVGFMAPDFVGNSFRIRLPNAPGFSGQCLITNGAFPIETWSYAACGTGGGGGGGTVTNSGVLALNTLVLGDGGVAVKVMASPGTTTTVLHGNATPGSPPTFGPVVVADIGATGTPSATTFLRGDGTWSTPMGSGTVTTSGTPLSGQVAFMTSPTAITGVPGLTFDSTGKLQVGAGASSVFTSPNRVAIFDGSAATPLTGQTLSTPTVMIERVDASDLTGTGNNPAALNVNVYTVSPGKSDINSSFRAIEGVASMLAVGPASHSLHVGVQGSAYGGPAANNVSIFGLSSFANLQAGTITTAGAWGMEINTQNDAQHATADPTTSGPGTILVAGGAIVERGSKDGTVGLYVGATGSGKWLNGLWVQDIKVGSPGLVLRGVGDNTPRIEFRNDQTPRGFLTQFGTSLFMGANGNDSRMEMQLEVGGNVFFYSPVQVVGADRSLTSIVQTTGTTGTLYPLIVRTNSTLQMGDTFGAAIRFEVLDADNIPRPQANLITGRFGNDQTATFALQTYINGVAGDRLTVSGTGQMFYTPTPTVGTFGFAANGTRRTEVQFHTDNNTNAVSFIAPATATGNHVWTLPSTFGASGDVLTNTGGGVLAWTASGGVTGSGTANRIGYWSGASTLTSAAGFTFDGAAMTIPGNLLATALTPDVSSSNPRLIVTEGASTPVGDVTAWRPYMRFILNNTATDRKSAIYIESINTGAPVSASRVNSGIQVFHASAQDNGGEVSGISSVEWLDGNAGTFQRDCRAVGSRPGSLPACVTSRAAGFSLEINGSGNMSNAISGSLDTTSTVISYAASVNSPGTGALQPAGFVAFTANDTLNLHLREAIRVMGTGLETTGAYSAAAVRFLVTMDGATRVGPSLANMGQGTINTSVGYYTNNAAPVMPSLAGADLRLVTVSASGQLGAAAIVAGISTTIAVRNSADTGSCTIGFVGGIAVSTTC